MSRTFTDGAVAVLLPCRAAATPCVQVRLLRERLPKAHTATLPYFTTITVLLTTEEIVPCVLPNIIRYIQNVRHCDLPFWIRVILDIERRKQQNAGLSGKFYPHQYGCEIYANASWKGTWQQRKLSEARCLERCFKILSFLFLSPRDTYSNLSFSFLLLLETDPSGSIRSVLFNGGWNTKKMQTANNKLSLAT